MLLHASCVAIDGQGILLMGESGSGKSDVALQLMDRGAVLVSDDQTQLTSSKSELIASPPDTIAGMIEVRHVGLMYATYTPVAPIALCVELFPDFTGLERMPEEKTCSLLDYDVRLVKLPGFAASTAAKIRFVLHGTMAYE